MSGLSTEEYRILYNKFCHVGEAIFSQDEDEDKSSFAVCFAEIFSHSKHLLDMIEKIAEVNLDLSESDLDQLLGDLVMAKILMYDELRCWMRQLRRPLQNAMDRVEDMMEPDEDEQ